MLTPDELEAERLRAIEFFKTERKREGGFFYRETFDRFQPKVQKLFSLTSNLTKLSGQILANDPELLEVVRFLAAPPVSEDDLDTLIGKKVAKRKRISVADANDVIDVVADMFDSTRFPWIEKKRKPTNDEIQAAINWTTGVIAIERARTVRRRDSAKRQQEKVHDLLRANGWIQVPSRTINLLDDLPRGHFCVESMVAGNKADVPVRLHDGRLLALECKVSNSATNSVKRLIRETCGKATRWREAFGEQIITGAVLAGVFKDRNLLEAQNQYKVAIFWEHDLSPLLKFIKP